MADNKRKDKTFIIDLQRIGLWAGATTLVAASICLIAIGEIQVALAGGLLIGFIIISTNLWQYIGLIPPTKDERAANIGAMAGLASWYITLIATVLGVVILGYLPESWNVHPTLAQGLGGVIIVMVVTMVVLYELMSRKSDVK